MASIRIDLTGKSALAAAALLIFGAASGLAGLTSEARLERSVDMALAGAAPAAGSGSMRIASVPRDGTEDFWLGSAAAAALTPVSFTKPVTVGDRLSFGLKGAERTFEVVDVRPGSDHRSLVVTCRDTEGAATLPTLKFEIPLMPGALRADQHL